MEDSKIKMNAMAKHMICAGLSGCITECIALPIDTIKTRLMMDASRSSPFVKTLNKAVSRLWKEGVKSFFKGLSPGIHRQILFASTRIGLYDPVTLQCTLTNIVHAISLWGEGALYAHMGKNTC